MRQSRARRPARTARGKGHKPRKIESDDATQKMVSHVKPRALAPMRELTYATGPDGQPYVFWPENSGAAIRRRLPRALQRALYVAADRERKPIDVGQLDELLAWVRAQARFDHGPLLRERFQVLRDAQAVLHRFRCVARDMRRTLPTRELVKLLSEADDYFARLGAPFSSLCLDDMPLPKGESKRPPEPWKERARRELWRAGINGKLAGQIVAAIARDVARQRKL